MEAKITVVVPIYNVEKYLLRCVDSITNQTHKNLEIILVDDGSPDNCGKICDELALKDSRIIVIHKPNGGLSDARNAGINIATGDYIGFVDSDDFIHPDMFKDLCERLEKNQADIAQCSFQRVTDDEYKSPGDATNEKILTNIDTLKLLFTPYRVDFVVAWDKLYRKDLFKSIRYPKSKIHEDEFTSYKLFYEAKKIVAIEKKYYYYYQSPNSIMRSTINEKKLHYAEAMEERIKFFEEKQMPDFYTLSLKNYAQWLLLFSYINRQQLKEMPQISASLKVRYKRVCGVINKTSGIKKRSKFAFRLAENCPKLSGILIYNNVYKSNILSKLAILTGLIDE